jgi:hypothetical protein
MVHRGAKVAHGNFGRNDRLVGFRRLAHFRRTGRVAIASDVDEVDVVAALGDQIHHRQALDRQVEGGFRRIGRAMHEDQDLVGRALAPRQMLIANEELDALIARRNHRVGRLDLQFFGIHWQRGGQTC